ncbi:unnamed protein product [Lactuca saligna]|uniref:Non-haem dioxygenase N-terminal domain-containing protein n=1 Tax=Lactuca saligna TaxID=75948 RepID=A0AA35YP68_LACSI|nr:unnamed protein product [Lactuca saligna]
MLWYSIKSRQPSDVSAVWFGGVTFGFTLRTSGTWRVTRVYSASCLKAGKNSTSLKNNSASWLKIALDSASLFWDSAMLVLASGGDRVSGRSISILSFQSAVARPTEHSLSGINHVEIDGDLILQKEVVKEIHNAFGSWRFFEMVNHRVPISVIEEMKKGVLGFIEQENEVKQHWYTRDSNRKTRVMYNIFDFYFHSVTN